MFCHLIFKILTSKMNIHFWSYLSQNISFRHFIHELESLYKTNNYCCRHNNKHSISQIYSSKHEKHFGGSYFHIKLRFYISYFDFLNYNQCLIHFNSFFSIFFKSKLIIKPSKTELMFRKSQKENFDLTLIQLLMFKSSYEDVKYIFT